MYQTSDKSWKSLLFIIIFATMSSYQYIGPYSDHEGKKVIKFMFNGVFYGCKYMNVHQGHIALIKKLLTDRNANRFSCIKGPFDVNTFNSSNGLFRFTFPFLQHKPLRMLDLSRLNSLAEYVETAFVTMLRGENEYFYSFQNMLLNSSTNKLTFAPYSIIGIIPLYFKTSFSQRQFSQVFQLLSQEMFNGQNPLEFSYKAKFRAIGMVILHLIIKKRISLVLKGDFSSDQISFDRARELVGQLKSRFERLLKVPFALKLIEEASDRDKVDYLYFLTRVFIKNCEGMTWKTVKDCIIPKQVPGDQDSCLNELVKQRNHEEQLFEKNRLQKLGIFDSQPDIFMTYKLQITKLNSDKPKGMIDTNLLKDKVSCQNARQNNENKSWNQRATTFTAQLKKIIPKQIYGRPHQARNDHNRGLSQSAYSEAQHLVESLLASRSWKQFMRWLSNQWLLNHSMATIKRCDNS